MKRNMTLAVVVGVACLLGEGTPAEAQAPSFGTGYSTPYGRPRVSPYLNLLRGGNTAGANYFTLVRPELDFRAQMNTLRFQTTQNQQAISGLQGAAAQPVATGHQVGFMTHLNYFQSFGGGGTSPGFQVGVPGAGSAPGGGQGFQGGSRGAAAPSRGSRGGR